MKTEQLHLFPELAPPPRHKEGICRVCGRKILNGSMGGGCRAKLRKEMKRIKDLLEQKQFDVTR